MLKRRSLGLAVALTLSGTLACAAIIGRDDRRTAPDFARDEGLALDHLRQRHRASLAVVCEDRKGQRHFASAALVERPDLVLTVAHVLMGQDGPRVESVDACRVLVHNGEAWVVRAIDRWSVAAGTRKVAANDPAPEFDWMVLRLAEPLAEVTPYRIEAAAPDAVGLIGTKVMNIAALHGNFAPQGRPLTLTQNTPLAPVFSRCAIEDVRSRADGGALLYTDCDTGVGASGSPLVIDEPAKAPRVIGMIVAGGLEGRNGTPYDIRLNASIAVHISGPLLAAIRGLERVASAAPR